MTVIVTDNDIRVQRDVLNQATRYDYASKTWVKDVKSTQEAIGEIIESFKEKPNNENE